jgi:hypothetical protein
MRLATSERTLNPAVMSKEGVDNEPAIKGPIDSHWLTDEDHTHMDFIRLAANCAPRDDR